MICHIYGSHCIQSMLCSILENYRPSPENLLQTILPLVHRSGFRTMKISKMKFKDNFKPLTFLVKSSILDVSIILNPNSFLQFPQEQIRKAFFDSYPQNRVWHIQTTVANLQDQFMIGYTWYSQCDIQELIWEEHLPVAFGIFFLTCYLHHLA